MSFPAVEADRRYYLAKRALEVIVHGDFESAPPRAGKARLIAREALDKIEYSERVDREVERRCGSN